MNLKAYLFVEAVDSSMKTVKDFSSCDLNVLINSCCGNRRIRSCLISNQTVHTVLVVQGRNLTSGYQPCMSIIILYQCKQLYEPPVSVSFCFNNNSTRFKMFCLWSIGDWRPGVNGELGRDRVSGKSSNVGCEMTILRKGDQVREHVNSCSVNRLTAGWENEA